MTELDKLKTAAELIKDISNGKLEVCPSNQGYGYIHAADDAYVAMNMVLCSNIAKGYVNVTFDAYIRRMGSSMDSREMYLLQQEVQRAHALVLALEMAKFQPTLDDLSSFHTYLVQEQEMRQKEERMSEQHMGM